MKKMKFLNNIKTWLINFSGVIALLLCIPTILVLQVAYPIDSLSPTQVLDGYALSDYGSLVETGVFFNFTLILCGILLAIFIYKLLEYFEVKQKVLGVFPGVALVFIAMFPLYQNPVYTFLHHSSAILLFIGTPILIALVSSLNFKGKISRIFQLLTAIYFLGNVFVVFFVPQWILVGEYLFGVYMILVVAFSTFKFTRKEPIIGLS